MTIKRYKALLLAILPIVQASCHAVAASQPTATRAVEWNGRAHLYRTVPMHCGDEASARIYTGGYLQLNDNTAAIVARSFLNGTNDSSFGEQGQFFPFSNSKFSEVNDIVYDCREAGSAPGLYLGLTVRENSDSDHNMAVFKLMPSGEVDLDFGLNGTVLIGTSGRDYRLADLELSSESSGKWLIAAGGTVGNGADANMVLTVLNEDGSPDSVLGTKELDVMGFSDELKSVQTLDHSDSISWRVTGQAVNSFGNRKIVSVEIARDGTLVDDFQIGSFDPESYNSESIVSDAKITRDADAADEALFVAGHIVRIGNQDAPGFSRLNRDGTLNCTLNYHSDELERHFRAIQQVTNEETGEIQWWAVGTTIDEGHSHASLWKLNDDCTVDGTFTGIGLSEAASGNFSEAVAVTTTGLSDRADDDILVGWNQDGRSFLTRLKADGTPQYCFNTFTFSEIAELYVDPQGFSVNGSISFNPLPSEPIHLELVYRESGVGIDSVQVAVEENRYSFNVTNPGNYTLKLSQCQQIRDEVPFEIESIDVFSGCGGLVINTVSLLLMGLTATLSSSF